MIALKQPATAGGLRTVRRVLELHHLAVDLDALGHDFGSALLPELLGAILPQQAARFLRLHPTQWLAGKRLSRELRSGRGRLGEVSPKRRDRIRPGRLNAATRTGEPTGAALPGTSPSNR